MPCDSSKKKKKECHVIEILSFIKKISSPPLKELQLHWLTTGL